MAKRIAAKVGEYQKDGKTKGEYAKIGVILNNDNGEYILLDPTISMAGVLAKQNALARKTGKQERDMVIASIFDDSDQSGEHASGNSNQANPTYEQGAPQGQAAPNDDIPSW